MNSQSRTLVGLTSVFTCILTLVNTSLSGAEATSEREVFERLTKRFGEIVGRWENDQLVEFQSRASAFPTFIGTLLLTGTRLLDEGVIELIHFPHLVHLQLVYQGVSDKSMTTIANLTNLQYLDIHGSRVTDEGIAVLQQLKTLKRIDARDTSVTEEGAKALRKVLPSCTVLVGRATERRAATKVRAYLPRNTLTSDGEIALMSDAQLKERRRFTRELHLGESITDKGVSRITEFQNLDSLVITSRKLTPESCRFFARLRKLRWISFVNVPLDKSFVKQLSTLSQLEELAFEECNLDDAKLIELGQLKRLKYLSLSGNSVTDNAISHIVANKGMYDLDLSATSISDVGIAMLSTLPNLVRLDVRRTRVSEEGVEKLRKVMPGLFVVGP
jgi:hypothetical protein